LATVIFSGTALIVRAMRSARISPAMRGLFAMDADKSYGSDDAPGVVAGSDFNAN
jgi:hypothetical protein